jgi:TldD protein
MNNIPDELASKVIKRAISKGGNYADIFIEHKHHVSIQLEDDKIEKVISGIDAGIGIRVILGSRSAYAYSNDFSEDSLLNLAETVSKAAKEKGSESRLESIPMTRTEDVTINLKKVSPQVDFKIKFNPRDIGIERKTLLVKNANRVARAVSQKIKQVTVGYRDSAQNIYIATSEGTIVEDERISTLAFIHVVAAEGDVLQTGYEPIGGFIGFELFEKDSFEKIAVNVAQRAVAMLSVRKISGGRMPVVISADAGGTMIHEAVGHGLEADLAQQGLSVYSNKIGQQIASPLITVIDDSTLPNKRGSFRFDDEGVPSQKTILVENGILKGYMYDRLTAMKDKVASTGNGRRESYECRPIPRMTNTFIAPGDDDPHEIIKSVNIGFFIKKMGGGQVNTVTGEFVFEVSEGYMIEKGQIGEPVRGATLIGNGPEVLKSIDMVGNDIGFSIGTCGKDAQGVPVADAMPTVRIPEIVVGGKVQDG